MANNNVEGVVAIGMMFVLALQSTNFDSEHFSDGINDLSTDYENEFEYGYPLQYMLLAALVLSALMRACREQPNWRFPLFLENTRQPTETSTSVQATVTPSDQTNRPTTGVPEPRRVYWKKRICDHKKFPELYHTRRC